MKQDGKREQLREVAEACRRGGRDLDIAVGLVMTSGPPCTPAETPFAALVARFDQLATDHLFVVDGSGELLGILTPRDLLSQFHQQPCPLTAADLMAEDLVSVEPSTSLRRAVKLMADFKIACLPVCSRDVPIGILTSADMHLFTEELLSDLPTAQTI